MHACIHTGQKGRQERGEQPRVSMVNSAQFYMPKSEVYEDYRIYCESHQQKSLSAADFGKTLKVVYPLVKPRRLGQRGQSRYMYCYSGIKKKFMVETPKGPNLDVSEHGQLSSVLYRCEVT